MMATESSVDPDLKLDIPEGLRFVDHKEYKITSPDRECINTSGISLRIDFSSSQGSSVDVERSMYLQETVTSNAAFDTNSNFIPSSHNEYAESKDEILTDQVVVSDISTSLERSVDRIERTIVIDETDKIVSSVKLVEDLFSFVGEQELVDSEEDHQANNNLFDFSGRTAPLAMLELDDDLDITVSSQCKLENAPASESINRNRDPDDLNNNLEIVTMPQQIEETVVEGSSSKLSESSCTVGEIVNKESWNGHADKENGKEGDLSQGHIVEIKQETKEDEKTGEVVVTTETITEEVEQETVHVTEIEEVWEYVEDSNHGMVIRKKNLVSQKEADEVNLKTSRKSHITTERHRKCIDDEANITTEVSIPDQAEIEVQEKPSITASDTENEGIKEGEDSEHNKEYRYEQEIAELSDVKTGLSLQENITLIDSQQRSATYKLQGGNFQIGETQQLLTSELVKEEMAHKITTVGAGPASEMVCDQNNDTIIAEHKVLGSEAVSEEGNQTSTSLSSAEDSRSMVSQKEADEVSLETSDKSHITTERHIKKIDDDVDITSEASVPDQDEIVVQEKPSITASNTESQGIKKVGESEHGEQSHDEQEIAESSDAKIELSLQENITQIDNQKRPVTYEFQGDHFQIVEAQQLLSSSEHVKEEIVHEITSVESRLVSEIVGDLKKDTLIAEHKVLGSEAINAEGNQISELESSAEDSRSIMDQQISFEHNVPASQEPRFVVFEQNQSVQLHHNQQLASADISSHTQSEKKQVLQQDGQIKQDNEKIEIVIESETDRNQAQMRPIQIERKFKAPSDCETKLVELGGSLLEEKLFEDVYYDDLQYSLTLHNSWLRKRNGEWQLKTDVAKVRSPLPVQCEGASNQKEIIEFLTKHYNCSERDFKEPISSLVHDLGLTEFSNFIIIQKSYKLLDCTINFELTDFGFQVGEIAVKVTSPAIIPLALQTIDNVANDLATAQADDIIKGLLNTDLKSQSEVYMPSGVPDIYL